MKKTRRPKGSGAQGGAEQEAGPLAPAPYHLPRTSRRRRLRARAFVHVVALLLALVLMSGGLVSGYVILKKDDLEAPDWLRARIEARIEAQSPGLNVTFSRLALIFENGWQPRLQLSNVSITMPDGRTRLTLADTSGKLALEPLLRGRLQPKSVAISGVHLRVRRNADGGFDLTSHAGSVPGNGGPGNGGSGNAGEAGRDLVEAMDQLRALLKTPDLAALHSIEGLGLTVVYEDLRAGRRWSVDGGRVVLTRSGSDLLVRGDFALLGGRSYATVIETSFATTLDSRAGQFALSVQEMPAEDLATQSPALAWLGVLDAPLSGALRVGFDETGAVGPLNATLQIGAGVVQPTDGARPIPFKSARSYFTFDPASQTLKFSELSVDSSWVKVSAEGQLKVSETAAGVAEMVGQLRLTDLVADPGDVFPAPVKLDGAGIDLRLKLDPFRLTIGQMSLRQAGQVVVMRGEMAADAKGWDMHLDAHMDRIGAQDLLAYWPESVVSKTREWIAQNVQSGTLENVQLGVRASAGATPDVYLGFEFSDLTAQVLKTLPPVTGASGHASLLRNRFVIDATAGRVAVPGGEAVDVAGTSFIVADVKQKPADGEVRLRTDSRIEDALRLLDEEPFRFLSKAGQPVTLASGRARVAADIAFPMIKDLPLSDLALTLSAVLSDVGSDVLVPGRHLAAPELVVTGSTKALRIAGKGTVDGVPFDGGWSTALGPDSGGARVEADLVLDAGFARAFRLGLPDGALSGRGSGHLVIDLVKGQAPAFTLRTDLKGLGLRVDAIGWRLGSGAGGALEVQGKLGSPVQIDRLKIDAPGLQAEGRIAMRADGTMDEARFSRVRVGNWLNAPVLLSGRGAGATPALALLGGRLDLRRMPKTKSGAGGPVTLRLDRLQISDTLRLDDVEGKFSTVGGISGGFTGRVNGGPQVQGVVSSESGGEVIRIEAGDAGGVLAAAGLLKQGRGGQMRLDLRPTGAAGTFDGALRVRDISIQDAPAMAALLSSLSVVGLVEQMAGNGIMFSDVEADFRLTPAQVIVTRASATGASLGVSMDGTYTMANKAMDFQGVVSPLYLLNGIGSFLTRKGEGLIGFNYTLQGTAEAPKVSVNPLSILAPGMLRNIFRKPAPTVSQ